MSRLFHITTLLNQIIKQNYKFKNIKYCKLSNETIELKITEVDPLIIKLTQLDLEEELEKHLGNIENIPIKFS